MLIITFSTDIDIVVTWLITVDLATVDISKLRIELIYVSRPLKLCISVIISQVLVHQTYQEPNLGFHPEGYINFPIVNSEFKELSSFSFFASVDGENI